MNLFEQIAAADAGELVWAVVVRHADGKSELHTWERQAIALVEEWTVAPVEDFLLTEEPVPCDEAAAALELLHTCGRCSPAPEDSPA